MDVISDLKGTLLPLPAFTQPTYKELYIDCTYRTFYRYREEQWP
jgi:hypothetical protein